MATSPAGTIDLHDYKRIGEAFAQGFLSWAATWALAFIPTLNWGKYESLEMILVWAITEAVKRYLQSPTATPVVPTA